MIVTECLNPKSPYNSACPKIIFYLITQTFIEMSQHLGYS